MVALRILLSLPIALFSWLAVLLVRALWGESLTWHDGVAVVRLKQDSWPEQTWWKGWGGFTFGQGIMLGANEEIVLPHEMKHVEQLEAGSVTGLVLGIVFAVVGHPVLGVLAWGLVPVLNYLGASLIAVIRGGSFYRDNLFEKAARDATGG